MREVVTEEKVGVQFQVENVKGNTSPGHVLFVTPRPLSPCISIIAANVTFADKVPHISVHICPVYDIIGLPFSVPRRPSFVHE